MSRDPYWLTARFTSTCNQCGSPIRKGQRAYYYPIGKRILCTADDCGGAAARDFASALFDERGY